MPPKYETLRDSALDNLKNYMDSQPPEKAKKLAYWIKDYTRFLKQEATFDPSKRIRYKRGSVIKAHLGYRIGSEEGGLHYAIVIEVNNSIKSNTLTIIPLTSVKAGFNPANLHHYDVYLGNEIYNTINTHLSAEIDSAKKRLNELQSKIDEVSSSTEDFGAELTSIYEQLKYCQKMKTEVDTMKVGSIALVGQITTISKIRVYDPKYKSDALSKIRVSEKTLNLLDQKVNELFCRPQK